MLAGGRRRGETGWNPGLAFHSRSYGVPASPRVALSTVGLLCPHTAIIMIPLKKSYSAVFTRVFDPENTGDLPT
jgi:hypothetical protein